MQLPITVATVLLAGILVVLVPGACLLAAWRLDRVVPPPLVPAAALALGLVPLTAAMSASLLLHLPIAWVAGALAALVLACWWRLAQRARTERAGAGGPPRPRDWAAPARDLVAGSWLRGTPRAALALALAGALLALVTGFYAWNDSLYHIGQAQKLLALDHPTFSNTLQFPDGTAHPGYLLPAWQEAIALVALASQQDPVTVAWILPAITFPVGLLAFGGLGWSVARSRSAAAVTTAAVLLTNVAGLPFSDAITNAMQPGVVALSVLAPLAIAMLLTALWPQDRDRAGEAASPRQASRAATLVAMVAAAGIGLLNVGYLWVLGMGVLGYVGFWLLRGPWPRAVVRRHLAVGASIAIVAGAILALLYPGLSNLEGLGRGAAAELAATDNVRYEGENGAELDELLRGDPEGDYHLRGDYLIQAGGLALLGLFGLLVPIALPRWPGGWYLSGAGLLALGIALSDALFPRFVDVVTLDQARRIERVLPLALGLAALVLAIAATGLRLRRREGNGRIAGNALLAGGTAAILAVTASVPRLAGYAGDRIVHPRVLLALLAVLAAWALVQLAGLVARLAHRRRPSAAAWPTRLVDGRTGAIALLVLLVGSLPVLDRLGTVNDDARIANAPVSMRTAELRLFSDDVAAALRELPTGSIVLADPRSRNAYNAMAIAPVYVVSSVPRHTALTPGNRATERFETALSFFEDDLDDARKLQLLRDERVDAVIVHPHASTPTRQLLERTPGVAVAASGKNQRLYLVDRSKLPASR